MTTERTLKLAFVLLFSFIYSISYAQTTLVLQPDSADGQDALVDSRRNTQILKNSSDFMGLSGTYSGTPVIVRSLINFDLSSIPTNAKVLSAELSLYSYDSPANGTHSKQSGSNACVLQRITSSWSESSITWNNQPSVSTVNQVSLAESQNSIEHYEDIDVSELVQDMINDPDNSYGFMLRLVSESDYRKLLFASSDNADSTLHPKLVVVYDIIESDSCIIIRPNDGKDALVDSRRNTQVLGGSSDYTALSGTNGGVPVIVRSLVDFDLSSIPSGATIDLAKLSLFSYTSPANGAHSQQSGSNACVLQRVTESWDESTITWNNQPASTTTNQAQLEASSNTIQDYHVIVTNMVQDMIDNPNESHGFMLKLVTESDYRRLLFASSDNQDTSLHPKLEICYSMGSSGIESLENSYCTIYPNPSLSFVTIELNEGSGNAIQLEIYNTIGELVDNIELRDKITNIDIGQYSDGVLIFQLIDGNKKYSHRIIKI